MILYSDYLLPSTLVASFVLICLSLLSHPVLDFFCASGHTFVTCSVQSLLETLLENILCTHPFVVAPDRLFWTFFRLNWFLNWIALLSLHLSFRISPAFITLLSVQFCCYIQMYTEEPCPASFGALCSFNVIKLHIDEFHDTQPMKNVITCYTVFVKFVMLRRQSKILVTNICGIVAADVAIDVVVYDTAAAVDSLII